MSLDSDKRQRGFIKSYNMERNFGFIEMQNGNTIFFHESELKYWPKGHPPQEGKDIVEFEPKSTSKGEAACEIALMIPADWSWEKADEFYLPKKEEAAA